MALERCNCARCREWEATERDPERVLSMSLGDAILRNAEYIQHRRHYREQHPIRARE